MKRSTFAFAVLLLCSTGCNLGQQFSCCRMNVFQRLHDRIHGNNVGAPCMSGACAAPAAPAMVDAGCTNCGPGSTSGYESYEGIPSDSYLSSGPTQTYGGMENVTAVPSGR
jgi:hypothetical protein